MNIHWKNWCWSWNSSTLATWCKGLTHLKRPWCWERLRAGGEGDDRGWDGMASPIQWAWVWASSGSWWRTGKPGMLQSMELQRGRHDWATELNWIDPTSGATLINALLIIRTRLLELLSFNSLLLMRDWRRAWQPTPVFLPGESHGQRSLAAYSPCSCKESDTTEWLTHILMRKQCCRFLFLETFMEVLG